MFAIIPHSRLWYIFSSVLFIGALVALVTPGMKMGIDFTGGTLMEVAFEKDVPKETFEEHLTAFASARGMDIGQPYILRTSEGGYIVRTKEISNEDHLALQADWQEKFGTFKETRFTTIGPTVGTTLKNRSIIAIIVASIMMAVYIAYEFRKIPRRLSPWRFGIIAVLALVHDVFITFGIFAVLGTFTTFEVNTLFVSAVLVILGYSVNDTIIIFDRVRENVLEQQRGEDFAIVAERALQQSMRRTMNTTISTLLPLFSLLFLGPESIYWLVLALIIGISFGAYSSIFVATPLLVTWRKKT